MTQPNEVIFPNPDGSGLVVRYVGDLLAQDAAKKLIVYLHGELVVDNALERRAIVLDDELELQQHLDGPLYQQALNALRDPRARRSPGGG